MGSGKGRLLRLVSRLILKEVEITQVEDLAGSLRLIYVRGEGLRGASFEPGDKVQLLLPGDEVRTYTPIALSGDSMSVLAFLHGSGPGAEWARGAAVGQVLQLLGPQRSLSLPDGRVVVVGDETSIGVAAALSRARPGEVHALLVGGAEVEAVARRLGVEQVRVFERAPGDAHAQAIGEAAAALVASAQVSAVAITGGAPLVVAVRAWLRERGVGPLKIKAYWAPGKTGLD